MTIEEQVAGGIKAAMLAKDADRLSALRLLKAAFGYAQIEKKTDRLDDADALVVIRREVKKRRDAIEQLEAGGRTELAAKERAELGALEGFLPSAMGQDELEALVRSVIQELGATTKREMGAVMQAAVARAAGRADGRAISAAAGKLLA